MTNSQLKKLSLKALSKEAPTAEERKAIMHTLHKGDDHSSAILGAAFIEIDLDDLLSRKLRNGKTWEKLTDANGPLSSFSQKILMGYAMSLYDECLFGNLNVVRAIRNTFAHARRIISFDHELVSAELAKIRLSTKKKTEFCRDLIVLKAMTDNKMRWAGLCVVLNNEIMRREISLLKRQASSAKRRRTRAKSR